jgi:ankyrin repeat protein
LAPIHLAIENRFSINRNAVLKALLAGGANPNIAARDGQSPLHLASRLRNATAAAELLNGGANVNALDANGETPLHIILSGLAFDIKLPHLLLDHGADLTAKNRAGLIPGQYAEPRQHANREYDSIASQLWWEHIVKLFDEGNVAELDRLFDAAPQALSFRAGYQPDTLLERAIHAKRFDLLEDLLSRRAKAGLMDSDLDDALKYASWEKLDFAVRLLAAGANVNSKGESGRTALHVAARARNCDLLRMLIAKGADLRAVDGARTTVLDATFEHMNHSTDRRTIDLLLEAGHPPTLLSAAAHGDVEMLSTLSGDDLQLLDREYNATGVRPLHAAVCAGQTEVVKWLAERGVDLNASNPQPGRGVHTPLLTALSRNQEEIALLLINLGADVNGKSTHGAYPVNAVVAWGRSPRILELLLARNANRTSIYQKKTVIELAKESKSKYRERYLELLGVSAEAH